MKRGWLVVLIAVMFNLFLIMQASAEMTTSWSGEYRLRPEFRDNADFDDDTGDTQSFYGQRARLGVNAKITPDLSGFVQFQDTRNWGDDALLTDTTPTTDAATQNPNQGVDIHQAFVTLSNIKGLPLSLKVGRQELNYGDQRLIGGFGWSNNGRAFDAIKLMYSHDVADIDFWTAKVDENNSGGGAPDDDTDFYGLYATFKKNPIPDSNLQAYLLYKRDGAEGVSGDSKLSEYTLGARLAGKVSGVGIDYIGEFAYQFGDNGTVGTDSVDISAYALAVEAGYAIPNMTWSPRVALEYDYATGSDDATDEDNTFNNLYPTNHLHYGYMDYQGWANMSAIALKASAKPTDKSYLYLAYWIFSLAEEEDGWYNAGGAASGTLRAASSTNTEDSVGSELDLVAIHTFSPNLKAEAGVSQFFTDDFIDDKVKAAGGTSEDSTWAYLMGTVSF